MDFGNSGVVHKSETRLADYKPSAFLIDHLQLTFEIFDQRTKVTAIGTYRRSGQEKDLWLDGGPHMELCAVFLDDRQLDDSEYVLSSDGLRILAVPDRFVLRIETRLFPADNTRLEGLYSSGGNLCTQCEAEGFRHISYYLDRPDVLTVFDVRIEADETTYPVLLSNGNLQEAGQLAGGRHYACWHDPFPKPCYLFALVAGNLKPVSDSYRTKSGRQVSLNIYVREHDLDKCDHAMQSLKRSMKWDEDVFDLEYDLDTYNIVAVSDFNMGAMENKGLNIFNTKYVLARPDTATDSDFDHVEGVIGHEYFHNWTGNRVTCRDWFQLSLKEGLTVYRDQEFSSDMGSRAVKRIEDVKTLRLLQFPEDAGPLAHPVRPESYLEINNFYTTTVYNKGAEVIRMMARILGQETFIRGVRHYLERYDGQAATCEQFVQCMEAVSDQDLRQFRRWYSQAGTPEIECRREVVGDKLRLIVTQHCPSTPGQAKKEAMHIPLVVGWVSRSGEPVSASCEGSHSVSKEGICLHLTESEQVFEFSNAPEGAIPSLLRGFSAPVQLTSDVSDEERAILFRYEDDAYARWQAGQELITRYLLGNVSKNPGDSLKEGARSDLLLSTLIHILKDKSLDSAFTAELLSVPSETHLGQQQEILNPEGIHHARRKFLVEIAEHCWEVLLERLSQLATVLSGDVAEAKQLRRLNNLLLSIAANSESNLEQVKQLVFQHYEQATNMTDQFGALSIIANSNWNEREDFLARFYHRWSAEELVVDKWFAVQAASPSVNAQAGIPTLMSHQAFTLKNPNRLRSLVSMFAMANQYNFHAADGSGYNLLSHVVLDVDKINPQTAARMIVPLGRWARLDKARQEQMKGALERILSAPGLSDDVTELAEKSLR